MLLFDDALPGFGVRVTAGGVRTFLYQYRGGKAVRRLRLGRFGQLTAKQARKLAETARGKVQEGRDPMGERRADQAERHAAGRQARRKKVADALTLAVLLDRWAEQGLRDKSASHRREASRAVKAAFKGAVNLPAAELDPGTVQREIDRIARTRAVSAHRVRDYARAAYNWAMRRRLLDANPFRAVVIEERERARDRVLTDAELGEAWRAAGKLGRPFGPYLPVLILTLQRRGEVAGMRWPELAPNLSTWTITAERAKNGKAHMVHLAEPVRAVLRGLRRFGGADLVSTSATAPKGRKSPAGAKRRSAKVPLQGFSAAAERLQAAIQAERAARGSKRTKVEPITWRWHDFRRTGVTALAGLGHPPHVCDWLPNHVQGTIKGVAAVYQQHEFLAERKAALEAWAQCVVGAGEAAPSNVVEMRRVG